MSKALEKFWPIISLLLILALLVSLLFWPAPARSLSEIVLFVGIGMAVFFTIRRNWQAHQQGKITRARFVRSTILDLIGLALTMAAALWLGGAAAAFSTRLAGQYAAQRAGASSLAVIAGLLAAVTAGFLAGWLVQHAWESLMKRLKVS
jgi:hypothetical protein